MLHTFPTVGFVVESSSRMQENRLTSQPMPGQVMCLNFYYRVTDRSQSLEFYVKDVNSSTR